MQRDLEVLTDLCNLPTAPYCEQHVIAYLLAWAKQRRKHIRVKRDAVGNVYLHYRHNPAKGAPPLVIEAHMDHPGFVSLGTAADGRLRAEFRGGVRPDNFRDARAAFWLNDPPATSAHVATPARGRWVVVPVVAVESVTDEDHQLVTLEKPAEPIPPGTLGMWDLPDAAVEGDLFTARVCDDLGGVAAILRLLEELIATNAPGHVIGLCTRAEEVGFAGVLAAARNTWVPRKARIIGLETSKAFPYAPQGAGAIVRVGDRTGTFSTGLTHFLSARAGDIAAADADFRWQRKLMDGGTCNSTAFTAYGYDAAAMCVALGNYHNMTAPGEIGWNVGGRAGPGIGSESIHLHDFAGMVRVLVAAAGQIHAYTPGLPAVRQRLEKLHQDRQLARLQAGNPADVKSTPAQRPA